MAIGLTDKELVKAVRGPRTKSEFARMVCVTRPLIPAYERGAAKPSADVWMRMARLVRDRYPLNVYCWQRAGLESSEIKNLLDGLAVEGDFFSPERKKSRARQRLQVLLQNAGVTTEPVKEPLGNEPVGGEPASLKGPSKDIEEFWARNPGVKTDSATGRAIGPLKTEPPAPAKKAKRERRRKK